MAKSSAQAKAAAPSVVQAERTRQSAEEAAALDPMRELQHGAGNQAMLRLLSGGSVLLQKKQDGAETSADAGAESKADQKPAAVAPSLIVEDDAKDVKAGQMRKSDFLSQLRTAATSAAETALAGTMWSAMGCPYIDRWLDHYSKQPAAYLERALHKYVPESTSVRTAVDYIPLVQQRLRRGIEEWRTTGEVKDLPPEFAGGETPGMTAGALMGGLVGGALSAVGGAISGAVSGIGSALSSVGHMLFKRHEGAEGETTEEDPAQIRAQLGGGHSLDEATQRRMQSAFGVDFAGVRVHTDTRARELTEGMQARAFTIGSDIAFGGDEYKPGTPVGDALIAHELAHVVQQGSSAAAGAQHKGGDYGSLEDDADRSAVGAVMKLWSGASGELSQLGRQALPGMRSGLRLQRCASSPRKNETTTPGKPVALSGDWEKDVKAAKKDKNEDMMAALVKKALEGKYEVSVAGKAKKKKVEAVDYQPIPTINFDINLNKKQRPTGGGLKDNIGLNFRDGGSGNKYAILGPDALDPVSPLITKMYADHEMYLAQNKLGEGDVEEGSIENDDELDAWTNDFINYFPQYLSIGSGRPIWTPLLDYYSRASGDARKASLAKLKAFYDKPADDKDEKERVQSAISLWVYKWKDREGIKNVQGDDISKELITDLDGFVKPYESKSKKKK